MYIYTLATVYIQLCVLRINSYSALVVEYNYVYMYTVYTLTKSCTYVSVCTVVPPLSGYWLTEHSIIRMVEMTVLLEYFVKK